MREPFDNSFDHRERLSMAYEEVALLDRIRCTQSLRYQPSVLIHLGSSPGARHGQRCCDVTFRIASVAREPLPLRSMAWRWAHLTRAAVRAARTRFSPARRRQTSGTTEREFSTYSALGHDIDMALARAPRIADWMADVLVPVARKRQR